MKNATKKIDRYVGKFFHTFDENGDIEYQGLVLSELPNDQLNCLMFEWFTGVPSGEKTFDLENTLGWKFYKTCEEWNSYADLNENQIKSYDNHMITVT